jgi:hypothetical protein
MMDFQKNLFQNVGEPYFSPIWTLLSGHVKSVMWRKCGVCSGRGSKNFGFRVASPVKEIEIFGPPTTLILSRPLTASKAGNIILLGFVP